MGLGEKRAPMGVKRLGLGEKRLLRFGFRINCFVGHTDSLDAAVIFGAIVCAQLALRAMLRVCCLFCCGCCYSVVDVYIHYI